MDGHAWPRAAATGHPQGRATAPVHRAAPLGRSAGGAAGVTESTESRAFCLEPPSRQHARTAAPPPAIMTPRVALVALVVVCCGSVSTPSCVSFYLHLSSLASFLFSYECKPVTVVLPSLALFMRSSINFIRL